MRWKKNENVSSKSKTEIVPIGSRTKRKILTARITTNSDCYGKYWDQNMSDQLGDSVDTLRKRCDEFCSR